MPSSHCWLSRHNACPYRWTQELGHGTYGTVYKARRKSDGLPCAVKEIPKRKVKDLGMLQREVQVMRMLHHGNILRPVWPCGRA